MSSAITQSHLVVLIVWLYCLQDRYEQVKDVLYSCIKPEPDEPDEDDDTKRKAQPLLLALQEAAFRSLGQAWPATYSTQGIDVRCGGAPRPIAVTARESIPRPLARLRLVFLSILIWRTSDRWGFGPGLTLVPCSQTRELAL
jgi:hypothetical protein